MLLAPLRVKACSIKSAKIVGVALALIISTPASYPAAGEESVAEQSATGGNQTAGHVECPADATSAETCRVDKSTYIGWRSFHTHCFQCHGGSAMGSTFAPSLLDRLNQGVNEERFVEVLENGYRGQVGAMPSFAKNTAVLKTASETYTYLRVRADGLLPPGRPKRLPK